MGQVSNFCPIFVPLQGDQVENGKMIQFHFCPVFVLTICHGLIGPNGDKSGTILRPMMTKSSPEQDKTENLKTEIRQKWDTGQKLDKMETETGQKQDKIWTVDKNETKVGIPTLTRSTGGRSIMNQLPKWPNPKLAASRENRFHGIVANF